jgi:hypothetical protein
MGMDGGSSHFFGLLMNSDGTKVTFAQTAGMANSYTQVASASPLPLYNWTHVAAVFGGGTLQLYINGQLSASGPSTGLPLPAETVPFAIGLAFKSDGNPDYYSFSGYAQDISYWSIARTQSQIQADMLQASPTNGTGLIGYWPLNDPVGTTAQDISGNGFNLTVAEGRTLESDPASVVNSGPYYQNTTSSVANAMQYISDGALFDFDGDGYPDLVITQAYSPPTFPGTPAALRAFHNNHDNTFTDVTSSVIGNVTMFGNRANYVADFTGDGLKDIFVAGTGTDTSPFPGEQSRLLIQTPSGQLLDQTATRLPQHSSYTLSVAVGDIDRKGSLDIYMGNYYGGDVGPRFYVNNGTGIFTEDATRIPTDIANRATGSAFISSLLVDVNGDGYPDLVLGGDTATPNTILMNNGSGIFTRDPRFVLPQKVGAPNWNAAGISSADLDGDGWPDLLIPAADPSNPTAGTGLQLLLNNRDGTFRDATSQIGVAWSGTGLSVVETRIVDLNGDGLPDIVAVVHTPSGVLARILLNVGGAQFVDVTDSYPISPTSVILAGDLNRDGVVELVTASSSEIQVAHPIKLLNGAPFEAAPIAPSISAQPANATVTAGSTAFFNVAGRAIPAPTYQWQLNGSPIAGATASVLVLPNVQTSAAGNYSVTMTNVAGSVTSSAASLTVNGAANLNFATEPISETVENGSTVVFNAVVSGAQATSYQWYRNGAVLFDPGATGPTLVLAGATAANEGSYTCTATTSAGSATSNSATLSVVNSTNPGRIVNISCRAQVGTGADQLIAGFVVGGQGTSGAESMLIRASGPALTPFGVTGVLADPQLTLNGSGGVLASNDGWGGNAQIASTATQVGAFAWTSAASADSALLDSLSGGPYTAQVVGASGDTGVALAEVYDATPSGSYTLSSPRLINISARVQVGKGGNILIAGFVIGGATSKTVLIRGSGPALTSFGVPGVLPDPELQIYQSNADGSATLLETDIGWGGNAQIASTAASVGAFSWGAAATPDSAILVTLPPGGYTAQVSGASGDTGVALVEIYEVQ